MSTTSCAAGEVTLLSFFNDWRPFLGAAAAESAANGCNAAADGLALLCAGADLRFGFAAGASASRFPGLLPPVDFARRPVTLADPFGPSADDCLGSFLAAPLLAALPAGRAGFRFSFDDCASELELERPGLLPARDFASQTGVLLPSPCFSRPDVE